MEANRFGALTSRYPALRIAVLGDFCLDRYLEIDPRKAETSIETGLPVHNVVRVRSQPGGAGTILNNLVSLGIGTIYPIGFAGEDGEGFEFMRALNGLSGVRLDYFLQTPLRRTFCYCKPLVMTDGKAPLELNRLDLKNWSPTPAQVERALTERLRMAAEQVDAIIVLDQVDVTGTGVVTAPILEAIKSLSRDRSKLLIIADSRRGLSHFPPVVFKMNGAELARLTGTEPPRDLKGVGASAVGLAMRQRNNVFVTLAEKGIIGATPGGQVEHAVALPVRGEIDIVGAGDSVTANLAAATVAGASLREAMEMANAAASVVIHKLGTTGTASVKEIQPLLL